MEHRSSYQRQDPLKNRNEADEDDNGAIEIIICCCIGPPSAPKEIVNHRARHFGTCKAIDDALKVLSASTQNSNQESVIAMTWRHSCWALRAQCVAIPQR